jgi:hypothetical protein
MARKRLNAKTRLEVAAAYSIPLPNWMLAACKVLVVRTPQTPTTATN